MLIAFLGEGSELWTPRWFCICKYEGNLLTTNLSRYQMYEEKNYTIPLFFLSSFPRPYIANPQPPSPQNTQ